MRALNMNCLVFFSLAASVYMKPHCGNDILEPPEECDDGNKDIGDGCSNECTLQFCSNTQIDIYEQCDDGNLNAGDGCSPFCMLEDCPNGFVDHGEECDDGNIESGDGCNSQCHLEERAKWEGQAVFEW